MKAFAKLAFKFNPSGSLGPPLLYMTSLIKMGVCRDAPLSEDFKLKGIIPIFFSHGITSSSTLYSRIFRDLARFGYLVIGLNHLDGSCIHTVNLKGEDMYHGHLDPKDLE